MSDIPRTWQLPPPVRCPVSPPCPPITLGWSQRGARGSRSAEHTQQQKNKQASALTQLLASLWLSTAGSAWVSGLPCRPLPTLCPFQEGSSHTSWRRKYTAPPARLRLLVGRAQLAALRGYSCQGSRDHIGCEGLNPGQTPAKQVAFAVLWLQAPGWPATEGGCVAVWRRGAQRMTW